MSDQWKEDLRPLEHTEIGHQEFAQIEYETAFSERTIHGHILERRWGGTLSEIDPERCVCRFAPVRGGVLEGEVDTGEKNIFSDGRIDGAGERTLPNGCFTLRQDGCIGHRSEEGDNSGPEQLHGDRIDLGGW